MVSWRIALLLVVSLSASAAPLVKVPKALVAAFSPDGSVLMTVSSTDRQVHFWNTATGEEVNRFGDAVTSAIFSGNGQRVMTWGPDQVVRVFDARTGKALKRLGEGGENIRAGAIAPDGTRAVTAAEGKNVIQVWDTSTGQSAGKLEGHTAAVTALAVSPDGKQVLSVAGDGKNPAERSMRLWELSTLKPVQTITLPVDGQWPYFSNNGKLALLQVGQEVKIFDLVSGQGIDGPRNAEEHFPVGMFLGDRKTTLRRAIGSAAVIDATTNKDVQALEGPIDGLVLCHVFSGDGKRVLLGTGKAALFSRNPDLPGSVYLFDVATGKRLVKLDGHPKQVTQVGLSVDGKAGWSKDHDNTLLAWKLP